MTINVAFFLPHFDAGGVERVVLTLLQHMDRERFLPHLFLTHKRGSFLKQVPDDIPVVDFDGCPMRRIVPTLCRSLSDQRIDVVYGGTNAANIALLVAKRFMKNPPAVVVSEHTPPELFLGVAKWKWLRLTAMRILYKHADSVAVPVLAIADELREILDYKEMPAAVLPNPVVDVLDMDRPRGQEPPPWGDMQGPIFITAGRLVRLKGFDLLIEAIESLKAKNQDIHLVILGEGPERAFLEALIESKELNETVLLPGVVDDPLVYFRHADCFVLSSRREGFGNVLIEAMASAIPVVSSDCPFGPRELLEDGKAGLLVRPDSAESLADGMQLIINDRDLAERLVARGKQRARDFDVKCTVPAFETLFSTLAKVSPQ